MRLYENGSVLYNVLVDRFRRRRIINYDRESDTISIETNINETMLNFELHKRDITCLKEYIKLLCHTIKQIKEDSEFIKEKKEDIVSELVDAKKIPSMLNDIEILKDQIKSINKTLKEKEEEINLLKKENKTIAKKTGEIKELKEENKNLKIGIADNQEEIEKINKKLFENSMKIQKMTITMFNRKYRANIGHYQIKNINLEGCYIGNIGFKDLCNFDFYNLETLNLSTNNLSDITFLENAKFSKLNELVLFFNKIKEINVLEKVDFTYLTKLGLSDNYICDIKVLKNVNFPFLEKLALSNNRIKDIPFFANFLINIYFFCYEIYFKKNIHN